MKEAMATIKLTNERSNSRGAADEKITRTRCRGQADKRKKQRTPPPPGSG
jgi:hypothetical protein